MARLAPNRLCRCEINTELVQHAQRAKQALGVVMSVHSSTDGTKVTVRAGMHALVRSVRITASKQRPVCAFILCEDARGNGFGRVRYTPPSHTAILGFRTFLGWRLRAFLTTIRTAACDIARGARPFCNSAFGGASGWLALHPSRVCICTKIVKL